MYVYCHEFARHFGEWFHNVIHEVWDRTLIGGGTETVEGAARQIGMERGICVPGQIWSAYRDIQVGIPVRGADD